MFPHETLEKHFTTPKIISPFYRDVVRLPRKLKKRVKNFCSIFYTKLSMEQRLWYYLGKSNPD